MERESWRLDPVLILKRGWVCSSVVVYLCVCISSYPPQGVCGPKGSTTLYAAVCVSVCGWVTTPWCGSGTVGLCGAVQWSVVEP